MGRKYSVPTFLFYPLVFATMKTNFDQVSNQGDRCKVFCGNQHIMFGVINSEWQKGKRHSLSGLIVSIFVSISMFVEDLSALCTCKHKIRHVHVTRK